MRNYVNQFWGRIFSRKFNLEIELKFDLNPDENISLKIGLKRSLISVKLSNCSKNFSVFIVSCNSYFSEKVGFLSE